MKTLHKYLAGQVLASLILTVAVFTFVLLLGNVLKDFLDLLIKGQARPGIILEAIALLIPFVWVFALPMGLLTATLLVFGRFSADQELTAARASGVSLLSLIMPVLLLSLLCCGLSAWINMDLGPRSRVMCKELLIQARNELVSAELPEDQDVNIGTNYIFRTEKNRHGNLEGVTILILENGTNVGTMVLAPRGQVETDSTNNQLVLNLFEPRSLTTHGTHSAITSTARATYTFDLASAKKEAGKPRLSDMTFWQLRQELGNWKKLTNQPPVTVTTTNGPGSVGDLGEFTKSQNSYMERIRVEMNRELSFSFACFGFTLVGIPLGIRVHRRETNIGIAIALILVLIYYSFVIGAESMAARPELMPHLVLWLPNFIFQGVGAILLWRANRGI